MDVNIGLEKADRKAVAEALSRVLADTYMLYQKTHAYHWNVTGPMFQPLHTLFEAQYAELHAAADIIAERIRALGEYAPGSYSTYGKLTRIADDGDEVPGAMKMVENLAMGHETLARTARAAFKLAEKANDQVTMDVLTQRLTASEKAAWMLRSHIENGSPKRD